MSGLEVARQVRQQARLNDCFLVAVTGRTDAAHRLKCEEVGIDLFLIKPVTPSILKTLLIWEAEYVSRSRQITARHNVLSTPLEQLTDTNLHSRTQLPCHVLQGAVAS
jgi:carbon storage regulator